MDGPSPEWDARDLKFKRESVNLQVDVKLTGNPLELFEPGTSLRESLPDLLGFVTASVELCSHFFF